jgi:predicted DNA-binding transcriptional regulator YafY
MRADRLVAILMMLQTRGQVTARDVADELEISERTARRDLEALGMAGLPVYSKQGHGGGWRLLGDGRTDLSGLTTDEARALFLVAGPSSGVQPEVKAALRKLMRALPEPMRDGAAAASTAVVFDRSTWDGRRSAPADPPFLGDVQRAVVEGVQVLLGYAKRGELPTERVIHPLGLVAKGNVWYLVAGTAAGQRTFRVDRVTSVELLTERAERPADFDLDEAWSAVVDEVESLRNPVCAVGRVRRDLLPIVHWVLANRLVIGGPTDDGMVEVEMRGPDELALAAEIAGFGAGMVVTGPVGVRAQLARIGAELVAQYR